MYIFDSLACLNNIQRLVLQAIKLSFSLDYWMELCCRTLTLLLIWEIITAIRYRKVRWNTLKKKLSVIQENDIVK